jgi:hypothetical protein
MAELVASVAVGLVLLALVVRDVLLDHGTLVRETERRLADVSDTPDATGRTPRASSGGTMTEER